MNLGLLLVPALGGYYLLSRALIWRYWVARQTGYKLFFSAALAGAALLVTARLVAVSLPGNLAEPIVAWWYNFAPFDYAGTVLISAFLAVAAPEVANIFSDKTKCAMRTAKANGDLIECLMQEAVDSKGHMLVEVSTKSSKCYIGFAQESAMAGTSESDIAISPLASGYRDSETRDLKITTNYVPALLGTDLDVEDFRVLILLSEVVSARRFDPDAYELLRATGSEGNDVQDRGFAGPVRHDPGTGEAMRDREGEP